MVPMFDHFIKHEIDAANSHLPSRRVTLCAITRADRPQYITREGTPSSFRPDEIAFLLDSVPDALRCEIRLPIIIMRRPDLGRGLYTVTGNRTELFLIHNIVVGNVDLRWDDLPQWTPRHTFSRPEVQVVRRLLPSTTCVGIATSHNHD